MTNLLLIGTTGYLGAHILAKLLQLPSVDKVYTLNRKSTDGRKLGDRQTETFRDLGYDIALLNSGKVVMLECEFSKERFGFEKDQYDEVSKADNLPLDSFID